MEEWYANYLCKFKFNVVYRFRIEPIAERWECWIELWIKHFICELCAVCDMRVKPLNDEWFRIFGTHCVFRIFKLSWWKAFNFNSSMFLQLVKLDERYRIAGVYNFDVPSQWLLVHATYYDENTKKKKKKKNKKQTILIFILLGDLNVSKASKLCV